MLAEKRGEKRRLIILYEEWNQVMHANSAYLCDWREQDGWFYLFYAGANDNTTFQGRSDGKSGVARSRDLVIWHVPGDLTDLTPCSLGNCLYPSAEGGRKKDI